MKSISCNVIVHATDTDIFFSLLKNCKVILCHNFYISLVREFVNITALMNKLGVKASYALLSLHAITGCNTAGKFNEFPKNIGLKDFLKIMTTMQNLKMSLLNFKQQRV